MKKLILTGITNCNGCLYRDREYNYCEHPKAPQDNGAAELTFRGHIPEWCPLEDE